MGETFDSIAEWQQKTFPNGTKAGAIAHLHRELSEVEQAYAFGSTGRIREELADVFILWVAACNLFGFSDDEMDAAINAKMAKNRERTWQAPDAQGVIEHVPGIED